MYYLYIFVNNWEILNLFILVCHISLIISSAYLGLIRFYPYFDRFDKVEVLSMSQESDHFHKAQEEDKSEANAAPD